MRQEKWIQRCFRVLSCWVVLCSADSPRTRLGHVQDTSRNCPGLKGKKLATLMSVMIALSVIGHSDGWAGIGRKTCPGQTKINKALNKLDEKLVIRAIIGEASGEFGADRKKKLKAMTAVAEAIRNRGTLRGVYGVSAKHVDTEPKWVFELARKAWKDSKTTHLVSGADHWENVKAFGIPKWSRSMTPTVLIGSHQFYQS